MSDSIILNIKKIANDFADIANSYLLLIFPNSNTTGSLML